MSVFYRRLVRPLLFRIDPERVHRAALALIPLLPDRPPPTGSRLVVEVAGIAFPNPVGLAAGYDKGGSRAAALSRLGFGFIEVGTVTPRPQEGNERPRLFRFPSHRALVNRMGFNNPGAETVARALAGQRADGMVRSPIGVNTGKQRETDLEEAAADYRCVIDRLLPLADYLVVNISSPNTPGLRSLEKASSLAPLLAELSRAVSDRARHAGQRRPPLFAKLSPDLADEEMGESAAAAVEAGVDGLVVTNTTTDLSLVDRESGMEGGLSGMPLAERALEAVRIVRRAAPEGTPIIGAGGIFSGEDAYRRIRAGASLVQIFTSLVYEGPGVVRSIVRDLDRLLERDGFRNVSDAVGTDQAV